MDANKYMIIHHRNNVLQILTVYFVEEISNSMVKVTCEGAKRYYIKKNQLFDSIEDLENYIKKEY